MARRNTTNSIGRHAASQRSRWQGVEITHAMLLDEAHQTSRVDPEPRAGWGGKSASERTT
jgi:hypothetical protein